jgi:hypothetical protein
MLKYTKTFLIAAIIIFVAFSNIFASDQAKIKGNVIAIDNNQPLPRATIVLRKITDSIVVGGAMTDKQGNFTITANEGFYYIEVKFIGYETQFVSDIKVNKKQVLTLPQIKLNPTAILQGEIQVEAEKEDVVIGIDSRTYNVTKDILAGGTNVIDVLRNIPSISVDIDDNIKMSGRTPKILIDGRESQLASIDMLKILSSDLVESVELITNPSAKYESEGVSGIINIILKKDSDNGFNGMVRINSGDDFKFKHIKNRGTSFNGNYKYGKLNLYASASYGRWSSFSD